jgi:hypothetical protein
VRGSSSGSGTQCGSQQSGGESVELLDLADTSISLESAEIVEVLFDSPAGDEIMEVKKSVHLDLPGSLSAEETHSDSIEVSLGDFDKVVEELRGITTEVSPSDTEEVSIYETLELTEEPESTLAEQALDDTIDRDQIPQSPYEELSGRIFLPGKKKASQEESSEKYVPLNLKIPAHARAKSNRRSLESIEPILDREAKLPLGPEDAPQNTLND